MRKPPVSTVPQGVDYDLWLGPAPKREFTRNRFHYNRHWFWDYGSGDLGNHGIHEVDISRWLLGVTCPTFITAVRSRKETDLNCPIEENAISCTLVHLKNISDRLGRALHFDAKTMTCLGDEEANLMFTRPYRQPFVVPETV